MTRGIGLQEIFVILLVIWKTPDWGRKVVALFVDIRDYGERCRE